MRGATLIELLIAMLLASIAIAGALSGLAHAHRLWTEAERTGRLHERAQYVFATLEPELQMAGYFGAGALPPANLLSLAAEELAACGMDSVLPLQPALRVGPGATLPCTANGGGIVSGSDVLTLRRVSTQLAGAADGALQLRTSITRPELGELARGGDEVPPQSSDSERRELRMRIFYVARDADGEPGTPALRVKSLSAIAGKPAFIDTEVMPGVEDMQIDLLPEAGAPRSVLVRLRVRADAADSRAGAVATLHAERRFNLRNAPGS